MKKAFLSMLLLISLVSFSFSEAVYYSPEQLTKKADLVITGKVIKVTPTGAQKRLVDGLYGQVHLAQIKVDKILKGKKPGPQIVVEFAKLNPDLEADVQDPQFETGDRGTAYLIKLKGGHYKALGGWIRGWSK
ncbi:hypothetical protein HZC35_03875 [Candidatus Saganbacteria bacterium]|nr:hypothetical protein [Candidatus Saganbacteria bacterium]